MPPEPSKVSAILGVGDVRQTAVVENLNGHGDLFLNVEQMGPTRS
jgi:hypothetical protein